LYPDIDGYRDEREAQSMPPKFRARPGIQHLREAGEEWQEEVLEDLEQTFGGDALFATVDRPDLDARHKRQEIETELIGAHHIAHDRTPLAQFGYDLDRSE